MPVLRVGAVTIGLRPSLSSVDMMLLNRGCLEVGDRSILKSPTRMCDLNFDRGSCSRANSILVMSEPSEDGGR